MKRLSLMVMAALVLGLLVAGPAQTASDKPVNLKFASFSVGGSWYIYAVNIAEAITPLLPKGSKIDVLPYQGGVGNPILVSKGDADLGLSFSTCSNWAFKGIVDYANRKKMDNLRAVVGGLNKPHRVTLIARKDAGFNSIQDIKDKKLKVRLVTVQRGGMGEALARQVLEAYGMTYNDITGMGGSVNHIDLPVALQQLQDGQADLFIHNVGYKQPDVVELCLRGNMKFLTLAPDKAKYLVEKYGFQSGLKIDKGEFTGVTADIPSIGYPTGVITTAKIPADLAYVITKGICENKAKLAAAHASLTTFNPTIAWKPEINGFVPLHPGAEKYYKEKGWMK